MGIEKILWVSINDGGNEQNCSDSPTAGFRTYMPIVPVPNVVKKVYHNRNQFNLFSLIVKIVKSSMEILAPGPCGLVAELCLRLGTGQWC